MTEYIHRWQLEPALALTLSRIMNGRISGGTFPDSGGIPSYCKRPKGSVLGLYLLAAEESALREFA